MELKSKILKLMYAVTVLVATISVNSTCYYHFYQEKLDPQLDSLKKYYEE